MTRRVLVTGGAGFLGRWVRAELEGRGMQAVLWDRATGGDILDLLGLRRAADGVDAVINLAGVLGTEETIGAEHAAAEVNVLGALNVLDAAAHLPVVQVATGHRGQLNPYAVTKACAEDLALARAQWCGQKVTVVRAFHAYGAWQKPPPPHGTAVVRKIVPSMVCRALAGMPVQVHGDGLQVIDLVHAGDVATALVDAISGPYGQVVEAGTGKPTTVLAAARDVIAACGSDSPIQHLPMRPGEPEGAVVVAERPVCRDPWPHRLEETVDHYRQVIS